MIIYMVSHKTDPVDIYYIYMHIVLISVLNIYLVILQFFLSTGHGYLVVKNSFKSQDGSTSPGYTFCHPCILLCEIIDRVMVECSSTLRGGDPVTVLSNNSVGSSPGGDGMKE